MGGARGAVAPGGEIKLFTRGAILTVLINTNNEAQFQLIFHFVPLIKLIFVVALKICGGGGGGGVPNFDLRTKNTCIC